MVDRNPCRTPVDAESKLGVDGDPVSNPTLYGSLAGYFGLWLAVTLILHYIFGGLFRCRLGSAEAEYRGVFNVVAETYWLCNLLRELHSPISSAMLIYCDNLRRHVVLSYVPSPIIRLQSLHQRLSRPIGGVLHQFECPEFLPLQLRGVLPEFKGFNLFYCLSYWNEKSERNFQNSSRYPIELVACIERNIIDMLKSLNVKKSSNVRMVIALSMSLYLEFSLGHPPFGLYRLSCLALGGTGFLSLIKFGDELRRVQDEPSWSKIYTVIGGVATDLDDAMAWNVASFGRALYLLVNGSYKLHGDLPLLITDSVL
ncbi:ribonuclease H-like domain-containing protein [Tanacetum coccineum]|uniref:Ribonuclease H-like domain-containing protein n=1 Tax=Tanacetum coccineum TaxID=301880 RepID=A0ABQ5J340_9ASTR